MKSLKKMEKRNKKILTILPLIILLIIMTGYSSANQMNETSNYTRMQAVQAINDSEKIIQEMKNNNFSILFVNDTLTNALLTLKQVDYAEILRGNVNSTGTERFNAQSALLLVNWQKLTYNDVINYTDEIKQRRDQAFEIDDSLTILMIDIETYEKKGVNLNESWNLFLEANNSFYSDRYEESENFINQAKTSIDSLRAESSIGEAFRNAALNFIQKYWYYLVPALIILAGIIYLLSRNIQKKRLRNKIKKMKAEYEAIKELEKKTQIERFKENKISGLTYNIRMKKYQEKMNQIKEEIPVLESRLRKFKK